MEPESPVSKWGLATLQRQLDGMARTINGLSSDNGELQKNFASLLSRSFEVESELRLCKCEAGILKVLHETDFDKVNQELNRQNIHIEALTSRVTELEGKLTAIEERSKQTIDRLTAEEEKCEKMAGHLRKEIKERKNGIPTA